MKGIKLELESIIQFAITLIQLVGIFLIKPDMFDLYSHNMPLLAGNIGIYLMVIISMSFTLLSLIYSRKKHWLLWGIITLISCTAFIFCFIKYNNDLNEKTFLATAITEIDPLRIIKGNHYRKEIKEHCELLKKGGKDVKEMDIIQLCAQIKDWSEIDQIWPKEEIKANTSVLLIDYYLCLILGGISLVSGVQAIKCKRKRS